MKKQKHDRTVKPNEKKLKLVAQVLTKLDLERVQGGGTNATQCDWSNR